MVRSLREPQVPDKSTVSAKDHQIKCRQKHNYDDRHRVQDTEPLSIGDEVWLPDQEAEGQVVATNTPRSYIVQTPKGQYRCNRIQINSLPHQDNVSEQIHQDNSTADMSPVNNLPDKDIGSDNDDNSAVTRTRSSRVIKPPKCYVPAETEVQD